jgi:hypothetical protein
MTYHARGGFSIALLCGFLVLVSGLGGFAVTAGDARSSTSTATENRHWPGISDGSVVAGRNGWGDGTPNGSNVLY